MKVGVPSEVKNHEYRVACTPAGVHELLRHGHRVCGVRCRRGIVDPRRRLRHGGGHHGRLCRRGWGESDLVLKVKEPVPEEYHRLRKDLVLFTYLHLAASQRVHRGDPSAGTTAIAYETVQLPDGSLPLLAPMSEVAGRMAPQAGRPPPAARRRRQGSADGRGLRGLRRQGRGRRGRGIGDERSSDRARHAGRGPAAGQEHREASRR